MKFKIFYLCFFVLFGSKSMAQAGLPEFGRISPAELNNMECSFEKGAPAYYLLNYARISVKINALGDFKVTTERWVRIKILSKKAYEVSNISIPQIGNGGSSKITDIEAAVYARDTTGNMVQYNVDKKDIYKVTVDKRMDSKQIKFTFPGIKPGCILEYRYTIRETDTYSIDPWLIQASIPVAVSYCEIKYPAFFTIDYRMKGSLPDNEHDFEEVPEDSSKYNLKKILTLRNIHSFRIEPLMSSLVDNLRRIEFSLDLRDREHMTIGKVSKSFIWMEMNKIINSSPHFGKQFDLPLEGTEKFVDSVKNIKNLKAKLGAVYQYVSKNVLWDNFQSMYSSDIREVWKTRKGNSTEINILLLNLLRKSGVNCFPLLFSTPEHGRPDPDLPSISQFNGLDVFVKDSQSYYVMDASLKNHSFEVLPINVVNRIAFLAVPGNPNWVNLSESRPLYRDSTFVLASLEKDGQIKAEAVTSSFDLSRETRLTAIENKNDSGRDLLLSDNPDFQTDSTWTQNKEDPSLPLVEYLRFHFTLNNTKNFYFLSPKLFSSFRKNPFTDSLRFSEIDFSCNQKYTQITKIILPPDMSVETAPKSIVIRMQDSSIVYTRKIYQRARYFWIENELMINRPAFSVEEYPGLRNFFKQVYKLLEEEIVLSKND